MCFMSQAEDSACVLATHITSPSQTCLRPTWTCACGKMLLHFYSNSFLIKFSGQVWFNYTHIHPKLIPVESVNLLWIYTSVNEIRIWPFGDITSAFVKHNLLESESLWSIRFYWEKLSCDIITWLNIVIFRLISVFKKSRMFSWFLLCTIHMLT